MYMMCDEWGENMEQEVYNLLCECADAGDAQAWNTYRRKNRKKQIDLSNAYLSEKHFKQFNFKGVDFTGADISQSTFEKCAMEKCHFEDIRGFGVKFVASSLVSSSFYQVSFSTAVFLDCDIRYVNFVEAKIHQSRFEACKCENSLFHRTSIRGTDIKYSDLSHSDFTGAEILSTVLNGSDFIACIVSGDTLIWNCYYDKGTNFTGVGLSGCRIEPSLLSSFQCNIRRIWWSKWYEEKKAKNKPALPADDEVRQSFLINRILTATHNLGKYLVNGIVKLFWWITDYGSSTVRLLMVFTGITLTFAMLYLWVPELTNDPILHTRPLSALTVIRALYFAVIIMTSVGFGDIVASPTLIWGHLVMMMQSLLGYILLGAFLVRIGILFQGEFPVSQTRERPIDDKNL